MFLACSWCWLFRGGARCCKCCLPYSVCAWGAHQCLDARHSCNHHLSLAYFRLPQIEGFPFIRWISVYLYHSEFVEKCRKQEWEISYWKDSCICCGDYSKCIPSNITSKRKACWCGLQQLRSVGGRKARKDA